MNNPPKTKTPKAQKPKGKPGYKRPKPGQKTVKTFQTKTSDRQSVAANYSRKVTTGKPDVVHLPNGDSVIEHSEFIQDLNGSTAFGVSKLPVNPGISTTFPWLSQIAPNYESYVFEKLHFRYENIIGSTASGTVMLGVDYDASDPNPVDKTQFASYQDYARDAPWKNFTQFNRRENIRKRSSYFVRSGPVPSNSDIKLYDVGNLFAATQGMVDGAPVGEVYVDYRVRFMTPQIQNPAIGTSKSAAVTLTAVIPGFNAGSNAPLTVSGDLTTVTVTATGAYDCLMSGGQNNASAAGVTFTGTATRQSPTIVPNAAGTQVFGQVQISFLPGQTFVWTNTGVTPGAGTLYFGQFNTSVL